MQTLKSFLDQTLLIWKDSTAAARFGLAVLVTMCVGAFIGVGYWSLQPHYVMLASDLDSEKLGQVANALDAAGISYTYRGSSGIQVDKNKLPQAKSATGHLSIRGDSIEFDELSPFIGPAGEQVVFRRNREKELELAIRKFDAVESADVQLNIPPKQAFIRRSSAPSAAVILTLSTRAKFGESQAAGIAKMVANSISDLTVDRVAITDTLGNTYSSDESLGQLNSQEEFRMMRERELTQKVDWILLPTLGPRNAAVAVTTEFTFPAGTRKTIEYDNERRAVIDETLDTQTSTGASPVSRYTGNPAAGEGVSGTGSNIGNADANGTGNSSVVTKSEKSTNKYTPSSLEMTESINTPIMTSMAISVVVNKTAEEGEQLREKLQALVQNAVGFDESKDEISIEFIPFIEPPEVEVPAAFSLPWDQINSVVKNLSLGVAAIIALLMARMAFKKIQPEPTAAPEAADRATQVNQLSELVKQNPEVFSKIIASWSDLEADEKTSESQDKKAA